MTKTKFINEPTKAGRRALRMAGFERLKERQADLADGVPIDYGVEVSYVSPNTYAGQTEGYLRYLLGTGGPREEIRFYHSPGATSAYRISFIFTDYTQGVNFDVTNEEWCRRLFETFRTDGTLENERNKALTHQS